jgi:Fibronectin type III domain
MSIWLTSVTSTSFTVNWSAHSGSVGNYNIEVYYANTSTLVKSAYGVSSGARSYGILGLSSCTLYDIKLYSKTPSGSTNYVEWYYDASTACPTPSGVGTININSATTSGFSISWSAASYADRYCVEVYYGSSASGSPVYTDYYIYSTSHTISGLSSGTTYTVKVWAKNAQGSNGSPSTRTTETVCATPTWVDYYPASSNPQTRIWLDWNPVAGADYYEVYNVTLGQTETTTNSYLYWNNLSTNTTYQFRVRAINTWYGAYGATISVTTAKDPPSGVGAITVGTVTNNSIQIAWDNATNADHYCIEYKLSSNSTWIGETYSYTGTSYTITGLSNYTSYDFKVYAQNSGGNGTPSYLYGVRTKDGIPPTVNITAYDGDGRIYFTWSASDNGSGIRSSNPYYVEITNANGGTYGNGAYTSNNYYSFLTDGEGKQFINGARYYVRVFAYDNENNVSQYASVQITYTQARPPDWEWHTPKISGNQFSLTANEWNSFCTKINQFRQYKNKSDYSFTTAISGGNFYAYMFNEARNAINEMSPSISVPSAKSSGDIIYASDLNRLRDSLNSIQ